MFLKLCSVRCSLLQIATQTHAFLFDLMLLEDTWQDDVELEDDDINRYDFSEIIKSLFSSAQVLKLGTILLLSLLFQINVKGRTWY